MIKRLIIPVISLLVVLSAFLWWRKSGTSNTGVLTFRTTTVQRGDVVQTVTGSGSLAALITVDVGSQVSGNIRKLYVDYNDTVKEGQLLAEIDPTTYEARLIQAEATLLSAQASLELKQLNVKRSSELRLKNLVAESDYDQVVAELKQQQAAMKNADASVRSAKTDVDRCKIYSPVNGVVLKRAVDVGQTVQSNFSSPTLFSIARDLRQMEITASISEADIGSVEPGQSVTFIVDAYPGRKFEGKVRQVRNNSTISNNVVTYPTIITADNADLKLRPGMTANITIATSKRLGVLRVLNSAARFRPPEGAVVVTPESAGKPPSFDDLPKEIQTRLLADFDVNNDGKLDAEERKTMETSMRNRMAASAGGKSFGPPDGGPGGPPPGASGASGAGSTTRGSSSSSTSGTQSVTIYVTHNKPDARGYTTGEIMPMSIYTGVSDSLNTEILSGIPEGAVVVTGTVSAVQAAAASTSGTNNIFGPPKPPGANKK